MKRLRDDVYLGSQFKRPFASSRGECNGQAQPTLGGDITSQKLTTDDALTYLKEVKDMFHDQREKYDKFLDVMKDFKALRINTDGVIAKVKELFKGHNNLILGFNTFLPKGFEITIQNVDETPQKKTVEFEEAISFVTKIKKRFQTDDHVYKSFLDILNMYRKEHKDIGQVYHEVAILFDDQPDLLEEFTRFLPDPSATAFRRSPILQQAQDDKLQMREKVSTLHADGNLTCEGADLDDDQSIIKVNKEHMKRFQKENHNQDDKEPDHDFNGSKGFTLQRLTDKKKSARNVEDSGANPSLSSYDDNNIMKSMYNEEFIFCKKVKERLCNSHDYQVFLKLLHIYSTEIINREELKHLVSDLLKKYPDLMDGFNEFLARCENIDGFLSGVMSKKSLWNEGHSPRSMEVERDKEQKPDMEAIKEKDRYKDMYMVKSIQELDLADCQRCTPSYRLLPVDCVIPSASQRSELGEQVLNDHWVSVTSGSEDYSFKHMRRNQYEESLFRCEDDRFELDMLIESVSSAAKRVEEVLDGFKDNKKQLETPFRIEDHFTGLHQRCIERLYGDHGLDVMDILRKSPSLALPVILTRFKQKQVEWARCRNDFNKVWAEIYDKNHRKSLDHRSFYFKQQDSKSLSVKSLLGEIEKSKEIRQRKEDAVLAIASGFRQPIIPDLEFEYSDMNIHRDLYKLVKYSCEEVYTTKEQLSKVMSIWATLLELMFGVPSRFHCSEATEGISKIRHISIGESDGSPGNSRQCKPSCNGDETNSSQRCRVCLFSGDKLLGNCSHRDPSSNVQWLGNEHLSMMSTDKVDGLSVQVASSNSLLATDVENYHGRTNMEAASAPGSDNADVCETTRLCTDAGPSLQDGKAAKLVSSANGVLTGNPKLFRQKKYSNGTSKFEKEEGELSPNGDYEEDGFVLYGSKVSERRQHHTIGAERFQDDEESENGSENGGDASDECSREENGEEGLEHDGFERIIDSEGDQLPMAERFLLSVQPLVKHTPLVSRDGKGNDSRIFYGNESFYVLLRLHQILYERILSAKRNSTFSDIKRKASKDSGLSNPFARFMSTLYSLLDGSSDNAKFEDDSRAVIGNQSYVLFTLDKLICKLVKQLQTVATDDVTSKLLQLYEYEKSRKAGKFVDSVYYENSRVLLLDEKIYRFECSGSPSRLSIQLMDNGNEKPEVIAVSMDPQFSAYLHSDFLSLSSKKDPPGILLRRSKRKCGDADGYSATEDVQLSNGLECKISCNSSKISYVLDTEDVLFRRKRRPSSSKSSGDNNNARARARRFGEIMSEKLLCAF